MTGRKRLGTFLGLAGIILLGTAGVFWRGDAARRSEIRSETASLQDSARVLHEELVETSLRLRGLTASLPTIPDSLRRHSGGKVREATEGYNKAIRRLEMTERDVNLRMSALAMESGREREQARARAVPLAGGGLAALILGAVLMLIPARRVGA
jgi:Flp pilus assembly protein TadB